MSLSIGRHLIQHFILGTLDGTATSTGAQYPYASYWAYQDIPSIVGTSIVVTQNQNGDIGRSPINVINGSAVLTNTSGKPVYNGLIPLFSNNIYVTGNTGVNVSLSGIPYAPSAPFRIWWLERGIPNKGYIMAPDFVQRKRLEFLSSEYVNKYGDKMAGTLDMDNNPITNLPAPTTDYEPARNIDLDTRRQYLNTGVFTQPSILTAAGGKITITESEVLLFDNIDYSGNINLYTIPELTDDQLIANVPTYYYASYNGGTPELVKTSNVYDINDSDKVVVAGVIWNYYGSVDEVLFMSFENYSRALANRIFKMEFHTEGFHVTPGLVISEVGSRNIHINSGELFIGANRTILEEMDTSLTDNYYLYRKDISSAWTIDVNTQTNNNNYMGSTGLLTLSTGYYNVSWVYRSSTDQKKAFVVLGTSQYPTLVLAQSASVPQDVPSVVAYSSVLVGRIIYKKGDGIASAVENTLDTKFSTTPVFDHNGLGSLQGGNSTERYHLTATEHANVGIHFKESFNGNGTNQKTLLHSPIANSSILFIGGAIQVEGVDYNIAGNVITFSGNVDVNKKIYIKYVY